MMDTALLRRRGLLGLGLAAGVALSRTAVARPLAAAPAGFTDGATLLVAGPQSGRTDQWATLLGPALGRGLPPGTELRTETVGGADGVTGANQFEARTTPDGGTALLIPGTAALAWLVGDPRARFDAAHWVPGLVGTTSAAFASRLPLAELLGGTPVRVGAAGPAGLDLPILLALDMMGANWTPVFGLKDEAAMANALARGTVDAVPLRGRRVPGRAQTFAAFGATPAFTLGVPDESGTVQRDTAFPAQPHAAELIRSGANPALGSALRAAAAAAQLDVALVLPQLTPAAMVAVWRRACLVASGAPDVQTQASALGVRPLSAPAAAITTAAIAADADALLELRRWLATRLNYRAA